MPRSASVPVSSNAQPTIVLVDDDAALRTALTFTLELDGFLVQAFDSGEALLRGRLPAPPVCLVLDQHLTGITGIQTVAELRGRSINLPALLITSHPKPSVREAAGALGVTIIEKPLLTDALVLAIHRALVMPKS